MTVNKGDYWWPHGSDYERLIDWVNNEAWKFGPPAPRRRTTRRRERSRPNRH
jgi:hypothetical protein